MSYIEIYHDSYHEDMVHLEMVHEWALHNYVFDMDIASGNFFQAVN